MKFDPSFHIRGCFPVRELDAVTDADERTEPCFAVQIPCGFETLDIAVYGTGLCESDAIDAAREFLERRNWFVGSPDNNDNPAFDTDSWICRKVAI